MKRDESSKRISLQEKDFLNHLESAGIGTDQRESQKDHGRTSGLLAVVMFLLLSGCSFGGHLSDREARHLAIQAQEGYTRPLTKLQKYAERGNPAAETWLSVLLNKNGNNSTEYIVLLRKAAAQNSRLAEFMLGNIYLNRKLGIAEWGKSIHQNFAPAEAEMGIDTAIYSNGNFGQCNCSAHLIHEAAVQGYAPAEYKISMCYDIPGYCGAPFHTNATAYVKWTYACARTAIPGSRWSRICNERVAALSNPNGGTGFQGQLAPKNLMDGKREARAFVKRLSQEQTNYLNSIARNLS